MMKNTIYLNIIIYTFVLVHSVAEVPGDYEFLVHNGWESSKGLHNEWTVEIEGGPEVAELVALEFGYVFGGQVLGFPGIYVFKKPQHSKDRRGSFIGKDITKRLSSDYRVNWVEQLFEKNRVKRDIYDPDKPLHRVKRRRHPIYESTNPEVNNWIGYENANQHGKKYITPYFNDELWEQEWYLQDFRSRFSGAQPFYGLNVLPVYYHGINGKGVRITVLDDGLEHSHSDLKDNYDPEISWDCNDHDSDPSPRYGKYTNNSHGTRCAGQIAMTANNFKCGVGVAWGSKIGGVRLLDGRVTDRVEGEALGYAWDKVDIYSASWGPQDNGDTVEGPGRLATAAILRGITKGRGGKGSIYVFANGNGGRRDNCNCDGYSSSIYTVSIGSIGRDGTLPWYGERCSSTLAIAYSSGNTPDSFITTTDTRDSCTNHHSGTSAAAPLAAGIIALALQANPNLTWRDVQHLIVWTSDYEPISVFGENKQKNKPPYVKFNNFTGLLYDEAFGYGVLNAAAMVSAALTWTNVPEKTKCYVKNNGFTERISSTRGTRIIIEVNDCTINYMEHVEMIVNIQYTRRGALAIYLTSPHGTQVELLSPRERDNSTRGFVHWPFVSIGTWGEPSNGNWTLVIVDEHDEDNIGFVGPHTLVIHGTTEIPQYAKNGQRKYTTDYNIDLKHYDDKNKLETEENLNYNDNENINKMEELLNTISQSEVPGDQVTEEIDPTILAEVEKELLRIHHRMTKFSEYK